MGKDFSREYISGIDGLRAIAVLAVILFHMDMFSFWHGGFTGVDVFFVISGYVISKSLASKFDIRLGSYILGFYKRRLTRIMPALLVMLLMTTLLSALFIPPVWLSDAIDRTGLSAFFGYSNFSLAWNNDTYFSPRVDFNPFLHTWSLAVEEQFYLIFPLIFYVILRATGQGSSEKRTRSAVVPSLILIALAGASFFFSMYETAAHSRNAFYLLPSRFWELAAGALLFMFHSKGWFVPKGKAWANPLIIIGLTIVSAGFFLAEERAFPYPWAILPVLGTMVLISGVLEHDGQRTAFQKMLASPIMTYIGRISYSLYLWHWPVAVLFRWTFGFESMFAKGLYVPVTFLLAMGSYHLIENPVRTNSFVKRQNNWKVVTASLAVIVLSFVSARVMVSSKSILSLSVTKDVYIWNSRRFWNDGPREPITDDPNILGRKLFAVGDSHTAAYRTMLNIVSKELGIEVYEYEQGGGAVAGLLEPMSDETKPHYEQALHEIREQARPGDVVFLASLRMPEFADRFEPVNIDDVVDRYFSDEAAHDRELALAEAHQIIDDFTANGIFVVMEAPLPVLFAPPYRCSDWFNSMNPIGANGLTVSRAFLEDIRQPVLDSIAALEQSHEHFSVWDPFPVLCTGEVFSAYDQDGNPILRDGDHLSGNGNRILAPSFREFLISLWCDAV